MPPHDIGTPVKYYAQRDRKPYPGLVFALHPDGSGLADLAVYDPESPVAWLVHPNVPYGASGYGAFWLLPWETDESTPT